MAQSDPRPVQSGPSSSPSRSIARASAAGVALALGVLIFYLVGIAFDGAHDGRVAGNESMALSATLGLYGLSLVIANGWLRNAYIGILIRLFLMAGIAYLVMGALMGNARWALPVWRALGYIGVFGGAWVAEYILSRSNEDNDVAGLVSLTAVGAGIYALSFEVVRWLEPSFRIGPGALTPEIYALQESTKAYWTFAVWNLYAGAVLIAAVFLASVPTRRLAQVMGLLSLTYGLLICLPKPAPSLLLRGFGLVTALLLLAGMFWSVRHSKHRLDP